MFQKILIANRGEIAVRIIRACREMGIKTAAVFSEADAESLHVRLADEAICIGPAPAKQSYLHIPAIISAAEVAAADAIHPGYGFLSENAEFAEVCEKCGFRFIGPPAEAMRLLGDKVRARAHMKKLGVPVLPGTGVLADAEEAQREAARIGYPVLIKASGGGGGRGMKVVREAAQMPSLIQQAQAEAAAGFKNPDVFLEKYVEEPRHIEFQILADTHGRAVSLGERECSIQRRHQKLIEESPSPALTPKKRAEMGAIVTGAVQKTGYTSAGTLEFLMDETGNLYFLEMNTRIQVEHPVTEFVTGVDLIAEQIHVANGERLSIPDKVLVPRGHAIECRINAEDPDSFAPSPGRITEYHAPGGPGVRVDSAIVTGWNVPPYYDSMIAKVIVHGKDRDAAIRRMRRALGELVVGGIKTNTRFLERVLDHEDFRAGRLSTRFVERMGPAPGPPADSATAPPT